MINLKSKQSLHNGGTLFERADGETFFLGRVDEDGSAQLVRTTTGEEHWGVHFDVSISDKVEAARQQVDIWPDDLIQ